MKYEKMMKILQVVVTFINVILMGITLVLQIRAFEPLRHTILCSCILLLITISLLLDGILKNNKDMIRHGCWYILWFYNLIINLFRI